ncbi:4-diphosphocytidyl-2-C-methyl-D-erythritol kinase [Chitinophaga costaii]|uniref:4-diphosphocytidyl-2-C-methyl-D-erythritol kinase n=1 Tax=Chitinophaga costaii TaxID=1335309 RepID=A0A1C4FH86_9BACT|nr:4-(cytidine 5'-diphospho)-2-C-methyl-D-erythritol kinase [Chitinophaga costaii]PUZ20271.1 4-(cytidine 5'-diphospho)-2-C-methyl-D-erythritol kinase [Chitinophaga costaii]SCC55212.1 4-diphosphocytidyl-2-C-methyl-D-erythritol kinase [Chitinophaga costaii]
MLTFPNCKINLGLHVVGKRADGFHELETVFYPLPLKDGLEVVTASGATTFTTSGLPIPGHAADNLILKAYQLLQKDFPQLPAVQVHLHKHIPMGAGLGGGSSNAAFMLQILNKKYRLQLNDATLIAYAAQLGSDCPFFIRNQPVYATGRGEIMEDFALRLDGYAFLLIYPGIHVNTGWAFSQLQPQIPAYSLKAVLQQPVQHWKSTLTNDFEIPVTKAHPGLAAIKATLYQHGALYATMSGSGSAIVGIFEKNTLPDIKWEKEYQVFKIN